MRTIEEIQKDLDLIQESENQLRKERDKLCRELREAEKCEMVDLSHKYILFYDGKKQCMMFVVRQQHDRGTVTLEGPIISYESKWIATVAESEAYNLSVKYREHMFDINNFKEKTTGQTPEIRVLTGKEYYERIEYMYASLNECMRPLHWLDEGTLIETLDE